MSEMELFKNSLWLRESGSYKDIFANGIGATNITSEINTRQRKDGKKSVQFRDEGNAFFHQSKYHLALQMYNQTVCYAENGTDEMANG